MPPAARPPVFTVIRPILIGACCAIAGIGKLAAPAIAAVPAMKLRRLIFLVMSILPVGGALLPARKLVADSIGSRCVRHQVGCGHPAHARPPSPGNVEFSRLSHADFVQRAPLWMLSPR